MQPMDITRVAALIAVVLLAYPLPMASSGKGSCTVFTKVWQVKVEGDGDIYLGFEATARYQNCRARPTLGEIERQDLKHIRVPRVGDRVEITGPEVYDQQHDLWLIHPILSVRIIKP
jgi:hypothetical protein